MSMAKCDVCQTIFDTDEDPDCFYLVKDKIICEPCRDQLETDLANGEGQP